MVKFFDGFYIEMVLLFLGLKKLEVGSVVVKYVIKFVDEEIVKKLEEDKNKKKGIFEVGVVVVVIIVEFVRFKFGFNDNKDDINVVVIDKVNEFMFIKFVCGVKDSILFVFILKVLVIVLIIIGKIVGKWMGFGVEVDEVVCFKIYGFIEMDCLKVIGFCNFEEYMVKNIKFNLDGSVKWEGLLVDVFNECKVDFGIFSKIDE